MSSYDETFTWPGPASSVILTGEFDDWKQSIHLSNIGDTFTGTAKIPYDSAIRYKFVVDGEWRTRDDRPTETGADYITNNILRTKPKPVGSATNGPSDIGLESSAEPTSQQVDDTQPLKVLAEETPAALSNPVQDVVDATYALAPENAGTPTHTREGGDVVATPTMINSEVSHGGCAADTSAKGVTAVSSETPLDSAKTYPASDPVNGRSSDIVGGALKGLSGVGPAATSTGESPKGPPEAIKVENEHAVPAVHEVVSEVPEEKTNLPAAPEIPPIQPVPVEQPAPTATGIIAPDPPVMVKTQTLPSAEPGKPAPIVTSEAAERSSTPTKDGTTESLPTTPDSSKWRSSHFRFPTSSTVSSPVKDQSVPPRENRQSFFKKIKRVFSSRK